jgi:hypothetical protein
VKELLKGSLNFGAAFFRRMSLLGEEITVVVSLVRAISIAGHMLDFPEPRICVRRRRTEFGRRFRWLRHLRSRETRAEQQHSEE